MEFVLQPGHDFSCAKKNNNNCGTGLVEAANYEEGSGRSRVCVCVCVWGGGGELAISGPLKSSKLLIFEHEFFDKKMKQ